MFKVIYSKEKDIQNYLDRGWRFVNYTHGREGVQDKLLVRYPNEFRENLKCASTREAARQVVESYLDDGKDWALAGDTNLVIKWFQNILDDEQIQITALLEKVYGKPFPFAEVRVYLTTFPINPHGTEKDPWFMVYRRADIVGLLRIVSHELNHLMFYYYYREPLMKAGLTNENLEGLKEAAAITTNPEGTDKPNVKELEALIKSLGGKTMDEIVTVCQERLLAKSKLSSDDLPR